eukprot:4595816-Alexandrium_andersonii.AAC.1
MMEVGPGRGQARAQRAPLSIGVEGGGIGRPALAFTVGRLQSLCGSATRSPPPAHWASRS